MERYKNQGSGREFARVMKLIASILSRSFAQVQEALGPRQGTNSRSAFVLSGDSCTVLLQTEIGYQSWQPTSTSHTVETVG